jgi:thioglycine synthase
MSQNYQVYKKRWQFMPASSLSNKNKIINFSDVKTYVNKDILDDIKLILDRLKIAGLKRAIIVDLSNPEFGTPVVRAIVPGLETFDISSSIMGDRAKRYFKRKVFSQA